MSLLRATDINIVLWNNHLVPILQSFLYLIKVLRPRSSYVFKSSQMYFGKTGHARGWLNVLRTLISECSSRKVKGRMLVLRRKHLWMWITVLRRQMIFHANMEHWRYSEIPCLCLVEFSVCALGEA